jgi:hypothetical protein
MARFVYVIVRSVEHIINDRKTLTKPGESDTSVFIVEEKTLMDTVVQEIVDRSGPNGMKVLRICAHGLPGMIKLGRDCLFDLTVDKFKRLNGCFVPRGQIELHSCRAGSVKTSTAMGGSAGWLTKLATNAGVPVLAAEEIQQADANWNWEGPVYKFFPLGGYNQDADEYEHLPRNGDAY